MEMVESPNNTDSPLADWLVGAVVDCAPDPNAISDAKLPRLFLEQQQQQQEQLDTSSMNALSTDEAAIRSENANGMVENPTDGILWNAVIKHSSSHESTLGSPSNIPKAFDDILVATPYDHSSFRLDTAFPADPLTPLDRIKEKQVQSPSKRVAASSSSSQSSLFADPHSILISKRQRSNAQIRQCRRRLNDKFQELLQVLPAPDAPEESPNYRSQILDYAINRVREIQKKRCDLERKAKAISSAAQICIDLGENGSKEVATVFQNLVRILMPDGEG